ncbi:hypothetical protein J2800_002356 [Caulobacter rhizosphaerae]|uniref:Uncharacterized protein n=1 Tax=Caulobacter rhizosphaerae TaxID=2010972 RepID=A0ABU1MZK6_9CAUL|nr:hypothetical protein [Caulobacter rhizosphaerae]MDR6531609.1 hypothetical protein [Caulobacter rhizosphaerae]
MSSAQDRDAYKRVVAQRQRNNIMVELERLAEGADAVRPWGFVEYFEGFFMEVPYEGVLPNQAITADEITALTAFLVKFREACDATPKTMTDRAFVASGWPAALAPLATATLAVFARRGLMDIEKVDPL